MNKSLITNIIALLVTLSGYFLPYYSEHVFSTGIFALSGAITNWLAIHMLFEKVPFLYGSGVVPSRFVEFKDAIKSIMLNEFFNRQHIERFMMTNSTNAADQVFAQVDHDKIFIKLVDAIMESSLGSMLSMFGGRSALDPLKEPMVNKIQEIIAEMISENKSVGNSITVIMNNVEKIIDERLNELTPQMVKNIVQDIIRKHLGWLVVWGGVLGLGCGGRI